MKIRNVLVVTGDPGGARVLIPVIRCLKKHHPRWKYKIFAGRNSCHLWAKASFKPRLWPATRLSQNRVKKKFSSEKADILVSGTSFENPTESWFRLFAACAGVPSFAVLDHWSSYRERFIIGKKRLILPDLIGVMDDFARKKMCKAGIPSSRLIVVGHPVLEPFVRNRKKRTSSKNQVLFVSEPISWDGKLNPKIIRFPRHNELTMLKRLFSVYREKSEIQKRPLLIRPHPLEPLARLKQIISRYAPKNVKIKMNRSRSLEKEYDMSGAVLGITSIALLQAKLMGVPVLSVHPSNARGWISDDIISFLPSVRSNDCFIEAVSKFILTQKTEGKLFFRGRLPALPKNSVQRMVSVIEGLILRKKKEF